jgi:hypothetical protein
MVRIRAAVPGDDEVEGGLSHELASDDHGSNTVRIADID